MKESLIVITLASASVLIIPLSAIAAPIKYAPGSVCPEFVEAEAKFTITNPPKGWKAAQTQKPELPYPEAHYHLEYVLFFDGPVERNSSLMPNKGSKEIGSIWELGAIAENRGAWIGCFYAGGFVQLSKQLPVTTKECRVKTSPSPLINGHRMVTLIECK